MPDLKRTIMDSEFSRRQFLQASTATLAGLGFGLNAKGESADRLAPSAGCSSDRLQGFVVSDAHFGWANPQQPNPAQTQAAMQSIMRRFDRAPLEDRLLRANAAQPPKPRVPLARPDSRPAQHAGKKFIKRPKPESDAPQSPFAEELAKVL